MPCMPRPEGPKLMRKGTSIAFHILGIPPNLRKVKKSPTENLVDRRLLAEETTRVR